MDEGECGQIESMKTSTFKEIGFYSLMAAIWVSAWFVIPAWIAPNGFFGDIFATHTALKFLLVFLAMSHLTISAMSICFHRMHTHHSVKLHPVIDYMMQTWLWMVTSMSKLDWVSVHVYHHTHSDTEKDPHSPAQKGLWRVFFLGVLDYSLAKFWPEVVKIRQRIPTSKYEKFISEHLFTGPALLTAALMIVFGPKYGTILSVLNFAISPLFAVGGVNAIAHSIGYKNYDSKDESRNIGFLFPLNWIISGELDHNNHHRFPKSPTFAHRWFEFDIGFVYIQAFRRFGLAQLTGTVPEYKRHALVATSRILDMDSTDLVPEAETLAG